MTEDQDAAAIRTEWLALPPERRADSNRASDFAFSIADATRGDNRRYQAVMNLIRPLIGRD